MALPTCNWGKTTVKPGQPAPFYLNNGGKDARITGFSAPGRLYSATENTKFVVWAGFPAAGDYTWTVTTDDGSASATITVAD